MGGGGYHAHPHLNSHDHAIVDAVGPDNQPVASTKGLWKTMAAAASA